MLDATPLIELKNVRRSQRVMIFLSTLESILDLNEVLLQLLDVV